MAQAKKAGTAVAEQQGGAVTTQNDQLPAHLQLAGAGKGNENVTAKDLTIPRLGLLQALSPQLEPGHAKFIPGASAGQMFNSLTNELYDQVFLTDIFYRKEYGVFVKRTAGGGFKGSFEDEAQAVTEMETMENKQNLEVIETGVHFCLMLAPIDDSKPIGMDNMKPAGEIVMFFTVTKLKVSRNMNSLIRNRGPNLNRWAGVFRIISTKETSPKGTYYNYVAAPHGWISQDVNAACEDTYASVIAGNRKMDREGIVDDDEALANAKM